MSSLFIFCRKTTSSHHSFKITTAMPAAVMCTESACTQHRRRLFLYLCFLLIEIAYFYGNFISNTCNNIHMPVPIKSKMNNMIYIINIIYFTTICFKYTDDHNTSSNMLLYCLKKIC